MKKIPNINLSTRLSMYVRIKNLPGESLQETIIRLMDIEEDHPLRKKRTKVNKYSMSDMLVSEVKTIKLPYSIFYEEIDEINNAVNYVKYKKGFKISRAIKIVEIDNSTYFVSTITRLA